MSTQARYDYAVVGSGFGGSVAALRLTEKGYSVVVLEQGHRIDRARIEAAETHVTRLLWEPRLKAFGYFSQQLFRHVGILGGVGVGGGSLVYGAVLLHPKPSFFRDAGWADLGVDWERELAPHYATAEKMLGRTTNPDFGIMDEYLRRTAAALGAEASFGPTPNGIHFGTPGKTDSDPYFDGEGPARAGCTRCGKCLAGCAEGAKNTLDLNYLHLAQKKGAQVLPLHRVTRLERREEGYRLESVDPTTGAEHVPIEASQVVLSAGVVGTLDLLFRARDEQRTLPGLSQHLGSRVRTNSEAIVGVVHDEPPPDLTTGAAISSHFYVGGNTHITQNRFGPAYAFMRFTTTPMVDDARPWRRALRTLFAAVLPPWKIVRAALRRDWYRRITQLTVMQHVDNEMEFRFARTLLSPFKKKLTSVVRAGKRPPTYLPEAHDAARALARVAGGTPFNFVPESVGNVSMTAHILGGCPMGRDAEHGVIDAGHQVFGYPGLFVVDGSAVSANVGVNPSLTITALAERSMSFIPPKSTFARPAE